RESRGEKGNDEAIIKTDKFLDINRPLSAKQAGLSRTNNVYAYIGDKVSLIDIQSGKPVPLRSCLKKQETRLLRLHVELEHCFVSDLDIYDAIKSAISHHKAVILAELAARYWHAVIPLREFNPGDISRPEVMITR